MQQAFTDAVRLHLDVVYTLSKPSVSSLHAACYHAARDRFPLPASFPVIEQARDKALAIYRGIRARQTTGEEDLRVLICNAFCRCGLSVENLRVFPDKGMARLTTPHPVFVAAPHHSCDSLAGCCVPCHMLCLNWLLVAQTGISCWP